jgi:hypothetical protein
MCDTIRHSRLKLQKALGSRGPVREMMTAEENVHFDRLPEIVTCYRGCDRSALIGASWTLDRDIANCFPFTNRYNVPSPVVVRATVKRDNILAVKLDREESEIITFSARRQSIEVADESRANEIFERSHQEFMKTIRQKCSSLPSSIEPHTVQHQQKGLFA